MYRHEITTTIAERGVIAIVRSATATDAVDAARQLLGAGLDVVEVALTTPSGIEAVRTLVEEHPDALIGAGTVLDAAAARLAVDAGARFLVSPSVRRDVIEMAHRYGLAVLPGAATPTEVVEAAELGADAVKLFPASELGLGWLRALIPVHPSVPFVPTGGIGPEAVGDWLSAGAVAVGLGSALTATSSDVVEQVRAVRAAIAATREE